MENNMEVPQKSKNRFTIWSSNATPGYIPKGNENRISTRYLHSHVYHSIIHNSQDMETTQMPINGWMDKKDVVHIHSGKGEYPAICNTGGPWVKWDKSHRERQALYDITYMWNLKTFNL